MLWDASANILTTMAVQMPTNHSTPCCYEYKLGFITHSMLSRQNKQFLVLTALLKAIEIYAVFGTPFVGKSALTKNSVISRCYSVARAYSTLWLFEFKTLNQSQSWTWKKFLLTLPKSVCLYPNSLRLQSRWRTIDRGIPSTTYLPDEAIAHSYANI